jgi:DhnA family fructose-bisphosphate aldolase class Ia
VLRAVAEAGADGVIASYGTIRDLREDFGPASPILKLDLTTVTLDGTYPVTEYVLAWSVDDAVRLGVAEVLTFVQLGADSELEALRTAGRVAAAADRAGLRYVCEIMPVESARYPDPSAPDAIAAATRTGAELGAHVVKTSMPTPPEAIGDAVVAGVPVVTAGGDPTTDSEGFLDEIRTACAAGAAGVAVGRNVWGAPDPAAMVRGLVEVVHGEAAA